MGAVVGVALLLTACSSTISTGSPASPATRSTIPASAFRDVTGITRTTVAVANISTEVAGLFTGARVGTQAYADYVNAQGGVNGRTLVVNGTDDGFTGADNKQLTVAAVQNDFAMVGGFSLEDGFGGTVLAADPQMPDVAESLDPATKALPNSFAPNPSADGWQLGPLAYFKSAYPEDIARTGALIADYGSAVTVWDGEKAAMAHLGYRVVYDPTFAVSQTDFNQNVVAMKSAGVKILFIEQMPENYASAVVRALNQQDFHPVLVFGASTYSEALVPAAGGPAAIDGAYLVQTASRYLGEDASSLPAVRTFLTWVQRAAPGFHADYYTLTGWLSAELFTDALRDAGLHPSRGSVLRALRAITSFSGGNLVGPGDPATKTPTNCYIVTRIEHGVFNRVADPPVDGPAHGYRCDLSYYYPRPTGAG